MEPVIIVIVIFSTIFGVFYLHYSTRNKERLTLIEKGADASIFIKGKTDKTTPVWKIFTLNLSLLLIGIGLAIFIGSIMVNSFGIHEKVAYPGTIFTMAGVGLLISFFVIKKIDKEE